jgi:hypothetical protein
VAVVILHVHKYGKKEKKSLGTFFFFLSIYAADVPMPSFQYVMQNNK